MDLDVYLEGRLIGHTEPRSRGSKVRLRYTSEVIDTLPAELPLLSCSLPTPGPCEPAATQSFLEGLLPEGEALRAMAASVRGVELDLAAGAPRTPLDSVRLLGAFGRECAGAVTLLPRDQEPAVGPGRYLPVDEDRISAGIAHLPSHPLGNELAADVRMSLAGAQPKLLLARFGTRWFEPAGGAASTHILKPAGRWPSSADNEYLVMTLARLVGLTEAPVEVVEFGDTRTLAATRYDRVLGPGPHEVTRSHQEDMCQAMKVRPRDKYHLGPRATARMVRLLAERSASVTADLTSLFRQVVFRAVVGDEDGHGKNYSITLNGGQVRQAPIYDTLCTLAYPELSGRMAMPLAGQSQLQRLDLATLVAEARTFRLNERSASELITTMAEEILAVLTTAVAAPGIDAFAAEVVGGVVAERIGRLLAGVPMGTPSAGLTLAAPGRAGIGPTGGTLDQMSVPD